MYEYNDFETLYLIREDSNNEAINFLINKYVPLINSIASRYFKTSNTSFFQYDDIVQEGYIGLLHAIDSFNQDEALFYTFASVCIERQIIKFLRGNNGNKNRLLNEAVNIDYDNEDYLFNISDFSSNSLSFIVNDRYFEEALICFKNDLSIDDAIIFELRLNLFCYKDIAKFLDIDIKAVDNRLLSIRKKLKIYLKNVY